MAKHEQSSKAYDEMFTSGGYEGVYELPYRHSAYFPLFRAALGALKRADARVVLEVGCGTGAFAHYLMDSTGVAYTGFDFSAVAVEKARQRTGRTDTFYVADATARDAYWPAYDAIVCTEVLEHVPDDLLVTANWRPGALCVCSVPSFDADNHERFFKSETQVTERYRGVIDIQSIQRVKKPPISDISWRSFLRAVRWNRYRMDRLAMLLGLASFDDVGGWFLFVGFKK